MLSRTIMLIIFAQSSLSCNLYNNYTVPECFQFIEYILTEYDVSVADIIYGIPKGKVTQTWSVIALMLEKLSLKTNAVRMRPLLPDSSLSPGSPSVVTVVMCDSVNMTAFLNKMDYKLMGSKWVLLGSKEMSWNVTLKLRFDSEVTLAFGMGFGIMMTEVYKLSQESPIIYRPQGLWYTGKANSRHLFDVRFSRSMTGLTLNCITYHDPPNVIVSYQNGKEEVKGFLIDVWKSLEKKLNFSSNIAISKQDHEGSLRNNKWTGLSGEVLEQKKDVAIMAKQLTSDLVNSFDPSVPVSGLRLCMYLQVPKAGIWVLISKLKSTLIPVLLLLVGTLTGFIMVWKGTSPPEAFMLVFYLLLEQAGCWLPTSFPSRLAVVCTSLLVVYLFLANIGHVISAIVIPSSPPVMVLEDMLDPKYNVLIVLHSATFNLMKESEYSLLGKIFKERIVKKSNLAATIPEALERVSLEPQLVLIEMKERVAYYFRRYHCCVYEIPTAFKTPAGFVFKQGLPYTPLLNYQLVKMSENGLSSSLHSKWWFNMAMNHTEGLEPLTANDVLPILGCLFTGLFLGGVTLFIERYYTPMTNTGALHDVHLPTIDLGTDDESVPNTIK